MADERFVTVLRTMDTQQIEMTAAMLQAEGIACQQVGQNVASMLGEARNFVMVELRVQADREADARALIDAARQPGGDSGITFRIRRDVRVFYAFLGWLAGFVLVIVLNTSGVTTGGVDALAVLATTTLLGYLRGRSTPRDLCSKPDCSGIIGRQADACPKCGARVHGEVDSGRRHLEALESLKSDARAAAPPER